MKFINKVTKSVLARVSNYLVKNQKYTISENYFIALNEKNKFFYVELERCIDSFGFEYQGGWQFFSQLATNIYQNNDEQALKDFINFLTKFQYNNVHEGHLIEFNNSNSLRQFSPSTFAFLLPWSTTNIATVENMVNKINEEEGLLKDEKSLRPLDNIEYLAINHFNRMKKVVSNVKAFGYKQINDVLDPVSCYVLIRENEVRYLILSGQHRVAAASAKGCERIAVTFKSNLVIEKRGLHDWPLVKTGIWSSDDAEKYFDHLFDFDSKNWAIKKGFLNL